MAFAKIANFVSIVIPAYNEEKRILPTLQALSGFCEHNFKKYEIVFVDDGSTDKTRAIVKDFPAGPCFQVVRIAKNRGKGYAVKQGMLRAHGQYLFFTDSDLPYGLSCFLSATEVFACWRYNMVVGARELPELCDRSQMNRVRRTGGRVFSAIANSLLKIDIKDTQCGFKGFTAHTARKIFTKSTVDGYAFDVEIFVLARRFSLSIEKMPVTLVRNQHSKVRLIRDPFLMLTDLLRLYSKQKQEL